jgi:predicted nucleotidyltransferase
MKKSKLITSIYKTLIYSDIFGSPLHRDDLYSYLYKYEIKKDKLFSVLETIPFISLSGDYVSLRGKEKVFEAYKSRVEESVKKLASAQKIINVLSKIPTILLIGITGSVAAKNAGKEADIDIFIITRHHSLWITRLLVTGILFVFKKKRKVRVNLAPDSICANMWMSEKHCKLSKKNVFIAREIVQMKIVCNKRDMYARFLQQNRWVTKVFPNGTYPSTAMSSSHSFIPWTLLAVINFPLFVLQYLYMKKKITKEKVSLHTASFHPRDISSIVLSTYKERVQFYSSYNQKSAYSSVTDKYITPGS